MRFKPRWRHKQRKKKYPRGQRRGALGASRSLTRTIHAQCPTSQRDELKTILQENTVIGHQIRHKQRPRAAASNALLRIRSKLRGAGGSRQLDVVGTSRQVAQSNIESIAKTPKSNPSPN